MILLFLLNFFFFLLLRYLIKKNIFSKKSAFIFICLQVVIFFSTPVRIIYRTTSLNSILPFEFFVGSFFTISFSLVAIPLIVQTLFSENKKLKLEEIENKTTIFLFEILDESRIFLENHLSFFKSWSTVFLKLLTKIVVFIFFFGKEVFFLVFFLIPWLFWIFFFINDFFRNYFYFSIYFFGIFLFLPRIFSLIIFFSKNYMWNQFNDLYLACVKSFYFISIGTIRQDFLNFQFLLDLIFKPDCLGLEARSKTEEVQFWKKLNKLIVFFLVYGELFDLWKNTIPKVKSFFYTINFLFLITSISFYYLITPFFIFACYLTIVLSFEKYFSLFSTTTTCDRTNFSNFVKELPGNIGFYQKALIKERNFSLAEAYCGVSLFVLPKVYFSFRNYLEIFIIVIFLYTTGLLLLFTEDFLIVFNISRSLCFISPLFS